MGEVIQFPVDEVQRKRMDQLVEASMVSAYERLVDAGLDHESSCNVLDNALEMVFGDDYESPEELSAIEVIALYDSIQMIEVDGDEFHVAVNMEASSNDNEVH